jgi:catechol 2,3-dioxygenase-like lactoylglutathione lyase family enzyme
MPILDHVGIKVTDLDSSAEFYKDIFGFEEVERRTIGKNVDTVALKVGTSLLFLLYHPTYQSRDPESLSGGDHFSVSFDGGEWERVTARARERSVPIARENKRVLGATGWGPCLYVLDPDGNEVEIKHA